MPGKFTLKRVIPAVLIVLAGALVAAGIVRNDVRVVISNATLLCYSCIGLK